MLLQLDNIKDKSKRINFIILILFKICLDIVFITMKIFLVGEFKVDFNLIKFIEGYFIILLTYLFLPQHEERVAQLLMHCLYVMMFIPVTTVYAFVNLNRLFMWLTALFWVIVFIGYNLVFEKIKNRDSKIIDNKLTSFIKTNWEMINNVVFIFIYLFTLITLINSMGLLINFKISNVYQIRNIYYNKVPAALERAINWCAYVFFPYYFAYFVKKKRWLNLLLVVLLQLYYFSVTGLKTYALVFFWVLLLMFIVNKKDTFRYIVCLFTGVTAISGIFYNVLNKHILVDAIIRRNLFLPARLSFYYYDFFSTHTLVKMSNSYLKFFFKYPYGKLGIGNQISAYYFNKPTMNSCNGVVADGYANFGIVGMLIWALIMVAIFVTIEYLAIQKDKQIIVSVVAMSVIIFMNGELFTDLVTHGVLLSIIVIFLVPKGIVKK